MSLFGGAPAPAQGKSLFGGGPNQSNLSGSLFGSTQQQQPQGSNLFGGSTSNAQPQGSSLFGASTATKPSIFGGATATGTTQQAPTLFGALASLHPPPLQPSLNNSQAPQPQPGVSGLFTRSGGLFGNSNNQSLQATTGLFGQPALNPSQLEAGQDPGQQPDTLFEKLQTSRVWTENEPIPPQKNVEHQIKTCFRKWNPHGQGSPFQTYLYNNVGADAAPFYRPGPNENEQKWEDALAKAPSQGSVPIPIYGFKELGERIVNQTKYFDILQARLHEINNGLSELLRRHDLEISARAAECRRRHVRLSQKCLNLATKTQILRNRGYALDAAEEELAQKLRKLEKQVLDPALAGREEEIWARMVSLRERGRILQAEFEKTGGDAKDNAVETVDEETMKRAKKILEDYDSQLTHLAKELESIAVDYEEWTKGRTT